MKKRLALAAGTLPDVDDSTDEIKETDSKKVVRYDHQDHVVTVTTEIDINLDTHCRLQAATSRTPLPGKSPPKAKPRKRKLT